MTTTTTTTHRPTTSTENGASHRLERYLGASLDFAAGPLRRAHTLRLVLIVHVAIRSLFWAARSSAWEVPAALSGISLFAAFHFATTNERRGQRAAVCLLTLATAGRIAWTFPTASNHLCLELIALVFVWLLLRADDARLLLQSSWVLSSIVLFWSGAQKLWWGTWWHGDFLAYLVATTERFDAAMTPILQADTLAYLRELGGRPGLYRVDDPGLVLVSRAVLAAELLLPVGLLVPAVRKQFAWAVMGFCLGLALVAHEVMFALLIAVLTSAALPRDYLRISWVALPSIYVLVAFARGAGWVWLN